jgi:hypothetical protein
MAAENAFSLLKQRRFLPLFCTQFLGAFNDCVFRNALIILLAFTTPNAFFNTDTLINLCAAIFVIPYFIFSAIAGQLADKFEKSTLIRLYKLAEVFFSALTILAFYLNNLPLLLISLFLLGTQATFFGPIKYSILPQHLKEHELMGGNGLIEMGTFIAILFGTMLGGLLVSIPNTGLIWVSIIMGLAAMIGLGTSLFIPKAKPCAPCLIFDWNPIRETINIIKITYQNKIVFNSIIGISWFWLYGSILLTQMPNYTKQVLNGNEQVATLLLLIFSIGIGLGSILCERLSKRKIEMGLVPLGALGMTLFAADFAFAHSGIPENLLNTLEFILYKHNWRILLDIFLIGIFSGLYLVPLYTLIQNRSLAENRSRVIAVTNVVSAIFMTFASVIAILFLNLNFTISQLFFLTAILNALVAIYIFILVPEFLTRFTIWVSFRAVHTEKT